MCGGGVVTAAVRRYVLAVANLEAVDVEHEGWIALTVAQDRVREAKASLPTDVAREEVRDALLVAASVGDFLRRSRDGRIER